MDKNEKREHATHHKRLEQRVFELECYVSKLEGRILVVQADLAAAIGSLDARIAAACGMLNLE